ncbi:cache domain-containing sensor histidine kinase [Halalkalibacter okhensis]|uniref:histidine kinase n=1 Tax=Halalkalibacter okhensis TaxID=333138 RepID=A0A0B0IDA2_9BACI|nr:sensor histidine kinase [Halalkalibacter okhensis]KHF40563.1 hypothetical protein LQ50_08545 [Halalkalibacter okhensis]
MNKIINKLDSWTSHIMVRPKLLFTFYIVSLLPLFLVATFFYFKSTQALKEELGSYMVETSRQVDLRLSSSIEEMENLSRIIHFNSDVQRFLNLKDQTDREELAFQLDLRNFLRNVVNHREYLWSVFLINDYGSVLYYSEDFVNPVFASWWSEVELEHDFQSDPFHQEVVSEKDFYLYPPQQSNYYNGEFVATYGGRLYQLNEEKGTLLFNFDPQYFSNMSDSIKMGQTGFVGIFSEQGESLFENANITKKHTNKLSELNMLRGESGYELVNIAGVQTLVAFNTSTKTGWKIVGFVPFEEVSGKINSLRNGLYMIAIFSILFVLLFSKYFAQVITTPLFKLQSYMRHAETGDLSLRVPMDRGDEFGMLTRTFNHMLERLEELKDKVFMSELRQTKLQLLNRESELRALQMQINPHFLYNTLNTMKCIGEVYDVQEVSDMSESLSDMFRYSIDHEKYKLLYEEVDHVKAFLRIIQIRFPRHVECHFDIPEELSEIPVLKLLLQPLVENAVEHGIIPKGVGGNIHITARQREDLVIIEIVDDGVGMYDKRLEEIQDRLNRKEDFKVVEGLSSGHIGLRNVQQRLQLNYGDQAKLHVSSKANHGTSIEIVIPINEDE